MVTLQNDSAEQIVSSFLRATQKISTDASLVRVWSENEVRWQCEGRDAAITATSSGAKGCGVLAGYLSSIVNDKKTKCLFVEDILWSDLDEDERKNLLQDFLDRARHSGAEMATVPRCGYADMKPFTTAGFIRTRRTMRAYLSLWNGMAVPVSVPSFYLDVL